MAKDPIWVLVADGSRARVFKAATAIAELEEIDNLVHPEARLSGRELETDGPGRAFDSGGQGRHAMNKEMKVKEREAQAFAKEVTAYLEKARGEGRYGRLVVAASPNFLGLLRDAFSNPLKQTVGTEIDKDLTQMKPGEVRKHLPERL